MNNNAAQNNVIAGPWGDKITQEHIDKAHSLKPSWIEEDAGKIWDEHAPELVFLNRLEARFARLFAEWCYQCAKVQWYRAWIKENKDVYASQGRQGIQYKMHPYVGQMHEHWRQMMTLTLRFGLTPSDEKSLVRSVHGDIVDEFAEFK